MSQEPKNVVKIQASLISDVYLLPEIVGQFYNDLSNQKNKPIRIWTKKSNSSAALEALDSGKCDIGVVATEPNFDYQGKYDIIDMGNELLTLAFPKDLAIKLSDPKYITKEEILQCFALGTQIQFLMREKGSATRKAVEKFFGTNLSSIRIHPRVCRSNEEMIPLISMSNSFETKLIAILSSTLTNHIHPVDGKVLPIKGIDKRSFYMLKKKRQKGEHPSISHVQTFWDFANARFAFEISLGQIAEKAETRIRQDNELCKELSLEDNEQFCISYYSDDNEERFVIRPYYSYLEPKRVRKMPERKDLEILQHKTTNGKNYFDNLIFTKQNFIEDPHAIENAILRHIKVRVEKKRKNDKRRERIIEAAILVITSILAAIILKEIGFP
jgi:DNA-binding transcriptional LysR family regulator